MANSGKKKSISPFANSQQKIPSPLQWSASACLDQSFMLGRSQEYCGNHLFSRKLLQRLVIANHALRTLNFEKIYFQTCFARLLFDFQIYSARTTPCCFEHLNMEKEVRRSSVLHKRCGKLSFSFRYQYYIFFNPKVRTDKPYLVNSFRHILELKKCYPGQKKNRENLLRYIFHNENLF